LNGGVAFRTYAIEAFERSRHDFGTGALGTAAIKRRLGRIFERKLHRLSEVSARNLRCYRKRHIDARGDAAARGDIAITHDPVGYRSHPERRQ
jgi:hypothetical protein